MEAGIAIASEISSGVERGCYPLREESRLHLTKMAVGSGLTQEPRRVRSGNRELKHARF